MKKIFILVTLMAVAGSASAQEELSKQLEVTRAYTPRVGRAEKLPVSPDMTDTVRLRPRISYSITSTASATSFETRPYEAATVGMAPFDTGRPLYIRAGAGVPFATLLDLYLTPRMRAGSTFGLFANHKGAYSKITNDLGVKSPATEMTNAAGLWGSRKWKRYSLKGDLTYDHRRYDPYGAADVDPNPVSSVLSIRNFSYDRLDDRISLGLVRGGVSFGDDFSDLSRFNFRVAVDGGYAHGRYHDQINMNARIAAAKMFGEGKHGFEVELSERGAFDVLEPDDIGAVTVTFAPRYLFSAGALKIKAGLDARYVVNKLYDMSYFRVAPSFEARANFAGGAFVPFVSYTSHIEDGDFETLSRRNPYVGNSGTTAWINDARAGFSGDLGDIFSYKISGGVSTFTDYQLLIGVQSAGRTVGEDGVPVYDYAPLWFSPLGVAGTRFTAGAEFALHNLGGFGARLYGNWNRFDFNGKYSYLEEAYLFTPVGDLPRFDAGVELSYRHKDILSIRLGAEFLGPREYLVHRGASAGIPSMMHTETIDTVVDLSCGVDVRVAPDFWVWIEGRNLANQALYPYPHYRGRGAGVMGGVKLVF